MASAEAAANSCHCTAALKSRLRSFSSMRPMASRRAPCDSPWKSLAHDVRMGAGLYKDTLEASSEVGCSRAPSQAVA